jgi:hypothetical protein
LAEHIGFRVWVIWTIVVINLANIGITMSLSEQFLLTLVPNLIGSILRIPYTFAVPKLGGRPWTTVSASLLFIPPCYWRWWYPAPGWYTRYIPPGFGCCSFVPPLLALEAGTSRRPWRIPRGHAHPQRLDELIFPGRPNNGGRGGIGVGALVGGALICSCRNVRGCEICRPAVASMLASVGDAYILDGEQASLPDTNDHFLANLQ